MEFKGIEHHDIFEEDVIIFWADISNPPQTIQAMAQEIDGTEFRSDHFGVCVNYSFARKDFYVVTDTEMASADHRNIFYIDQNGNKHWFKADIPQELLDQMIGECKKIVQKTEVEKRLTAYIQSDEFQQDLADLAQDYRSLGLPVPTAEQLRDEIMRETRKCLESVMACEAKGHLWKEKADPENGTSELNCRRCGAAEHLRW